MAKIGEGHAAAMDRAGFKELAQVLPAFPAHSVQPVEEPGLAGNPVAISHSPSGSFAKEVAAYQGRADFRPTPQRDVER